MEKLCLQSTIEVYARVIKAAGSTDSDFKKTWKIAKKKCLRTPKKTLSNKMSCDGSGPPQTMRPKSGQKVIPARTWDHLDTFFLRAFCQIEVAAFSRHQKGARRSSAAAPLFGSLVVKNLTENCLNGPRSWLGSFFDNFLDTSFGESPGPSKDNFLTMLSWGSETIFFNPLGFLAVEPGALIMLGVVTTYPKRTRYHPTEEWSCGVFVPARIW